MTERTAVEDQIALFVRWAESRGDITGAALAGSHARGDATEDSDVDLLVLADDPASYLRDRTWLRALGTVETVAVEEWGAITSLRVRYAGGREVELGLTTPQWASVDPVDLGTARVVRDGFRILHDPRRMLDRLVRHVRPTA